MNFYSQGVAMNFMVDDPLPPTAESLSIPGVVATTGRPPAWQDDIDIRINGSLFCWIRFCHNTKRWCMNQIDTHPAVWFATKEEALQYALVLARFSST